jgi:hypothetical protein
MIHQDAADERFSDADQLIIQVAFGFSFTRTSETCSDYNDAKTQRAVIAPVISQLLTDPTSVFWQFCVGLTFHERYTEITKYYDTTAQLALKPIAKKREVMRQAQQIIQMARCHSIVHPAR